MTDPQTVAEHLAAIRRMVSTREHPSDVLAALDALALAWVEPAPAVDESEPPIGYSAQEAGPKGQWFGRLLDSHGALEWTDWCSSRPAAVAACWAHMRAEAGR